MSDTEEPRKDVDEHSEATDAVEAENDEEPSLIDLELAAYSWPDATSFQTAPLFNAIHDQRADKIEQAAAETNLELRDHDGSTYLHFAYKVRAQLDVVRELLPYSDLSQRDENGDSAIDLALANQEFYGEGFLKTVEEYLYKVMVDGDTVRMENLVIGGMEVPRPSSAQREQIRTASEDMDNLIESLQGFEGRISQVHNAVHQGDLGALKQALEKKILAKGRDVTGMIPLHKAVIFQHEELVHYLADNFPILLDTTDHMGRTSLHYAAVCDDQLYQLLLDNGASEDSTDIKGKTPSDYREDKTLIDLNDVQERILEKTAQLRKTMRSRPSTSELHAKSGLTGETRDADGRDSRRNVMIPTYDPKRDPFLAERAPPPKTPETNYVADNLGEPLTLALADIVDKRPWDPIEFLAQWLIHYSKQSKYQQKLKEENEKLEAEKEAAMSEEARANKCADEIKVMLEEEEKRKKEEAEKQRLKELEEKRRQESSLSAPDLPTVEEGDEPESARLEPKPGLRDENGQTELHRAATTEDSNLAELLESGFDLTMRDKNGKTAYQLADEAGIEANKVTIDGHVLKLFEQGQVDQITLLVYNGYESVPDLEAKFPDMEGLTEEVQTTWRTRSEVQEQIAQAREAVLPGDLDTLSTTLVNPAHIRARDKRGHTLLHTAVLNINTDAISYLLDANNDCVNDVDNYDRTALHYAAAIDGNMYTVLRAARADETLTDIFGNMASHYIDNRADIFNSVQGLEELVQVHIAKLAQEISDAADGLEADIERRVSKIADEDDDDDEDVQTQPTADEPEMDEA